MINDFSVGLRTGSNPADINRIRSNTGEKNEIYVFVFNHKIRVKIYFYGKGKKIKQQKIPNLTVWGETR